jgi:hypothetical protein
VTTTGANPKLDFDLVHQQLVKLSSILLLPFAQLEQVDERSRVHKAHHRQLHFREQSLQLSAKLST